jgi:hypothetical protein
LQSCIAAVTQEADAIKRKLEELCKLRQQSIRDQHDSHARSRFKQYTAAIIASQNGKLQDILNRVTNLLQEVSESVPVRARHVQALRAACVPCHLTSRTRSLADFCSDYIYALRSYYWARGGRHHLCLRTAPSTQCVTTSCADAILLVSHAGPCVSPVLADARQEAQEMCSTCCTDAATACAAATSDGEAQRGSVNAAGGVWICTDATCLFPIPMPQGSFQLIVAAGLMLMLLQLSC